MWETTKICRVFSVTKLCLLFSQSCSTLYKWTAGISSWDHSVGLGFDIAYFVGRLYIVLLQILDWSATYAGLIPQRKTLRNICCFASKSDLVLWSLVSCLLFTGGCNKMRGEYWSQLPLPLAGDCCLCLWTLCEGHCVIPPPREVKDNAARWIFEADRPALHTSNNTPLKLPLCWIMFTLLCTEPSLMNTS